MKFKNDPNIVLKFYSVRLNWEMSEYRDGVQVSLILSSHTSNIWRNTGIGKMFSLWLKSWPFKKQFGSIPEFNSNDIIPNYTTSKWVILN